MNDYRYIHIICEGLTEVNFFREVVLPYLNKKCHCAHNPKITNLGGVGRTEKEGYIRIKKHLRAAIMSYINNERKISQKAFFTTFIDYYKFPKVNIPQYTYKELPDIYQRTSDRQQGLKNALLKEKELTDFQHLFEFEPFLMLHETETLVFVDPEKLYGIATTRKAIIKDLVNQTLQISNVEEINDSNSTSPKHRLQKSFETYKEIYYEKTCTPQVANAIGMPALIDKCRHFKCWVDMLCEKLKAECP